jgi:O-antigen/teichoic acid export membrane protein
LSILTARLLGAAGRGSYVFPSIDASISTTFAAGLSSAAVYFLVNRRAGSSIARAATVVLSIFVLAGFCATYAMAAVSHSLWAIVPAGAFVVSYSVYSLAYGLFLGINRARSAGLLNAAAYLLTLGLVSAALLHDHRTPWLAISGWVAGTALAGGIGIIVVLRQTRRLEGEIVGYKSLLVFAARAGLVNLANFLNYRIDIYVVAILAPVSIVGLYTLAVTGAEAALSLTQAISQATLPRIGGLERTEAAAFTARLLRNSIFLAFLLALGGMLLAPLMVRLILGPAYAAIVTPFRVLLVGLVAASTSAMISNYFMVNRGDTRVPLVTSLISTALCAAASFALVPRIGMVGAAVGSTVAYLVSQTVAIWLFCTESGIAWPSAVFVNRQDLAFYAKVVRRIGLRGSSL